MAGKNGRVRSAVFEAWTYFVAAGRIDRLEVEQYLSSCFTTLQPQEENYVWNAWVEAVAHLGFAGLTGIVRNAFELGRIPPMTILFDEFEEILEAALRDSLLRSKGGCRDRADAVGNKSTVSGLFSCLEFINEFIDARAKQAHRLIIPDRWKYFSRLFGHFVFV